MFEAFSEEMYANVKKKLSEAETVLKADELPFESEVIRYDAKTNPDKSTCDYAGARKY